MTDLRSRDFLSRVLALHPLSTLSLRIYAFPTSSPHPDLPPKGGRGLYLPRDISCLKITNGDSSVRLSACWICWRPFDTWPPSRMARKNLL